MTRYVALLRGINVGGKAKIDMKQLKLACESLGWSDVRTYINSGNVLFRHDERDAAVLARELSQAIERVFGLVVGVVVRSETELRAVVEAVPPEWHNGSDMKCDVVFVYDELPVDELLARLEPREGIEQARATPTALIWMVARRDATRSRLVRIAGTPAYKLVTVRNINTTRTLLNLMEAM